MEDEVYEPYDYHRAGLEEDKRRNTSNELSDARADALQSMIDIILKHKKEITKIPSATTLKGAQAWAAKRPNAGFRVAYTDIGGDPEKEVVVYDKAGRPFMINGYKMKPSDYGLRKAYYENNPTSEDRAGNPMRAWATEYAWETKEEDDNKWNRSVRQSENYEKMKAWGFRMPTKPKTEISPYAIFSKLVAPMVKQVVEGEEFKQKISAGFGQPEEGIGDDCMKFLGKILSPISYYRYLYMRLVEQKYFFSLRQSPDTQRKVQNYAQFKAYCKKNKATFRKWFIDNILSGAKKEKFVSAWVNEEVIMDALIKDDLQVDGTDLQDGFIQMLGQENVQEESVIEHTDDKGAKTDISFINILTDNSLAKEFLEHAADKRSSGYRVCKQALEKCKRRAQKATDRYFKDEKVKKLFFEDSKAEAVFMQGVEEGVPNATSEESAKRQQAAASSPAKPPVVEQQKEGGDEA